MLTHSASELSGFTCTSSLTMNEKFQYRTRPPIGSSVQVQHMSLTKHNKETHVDTKFRTSSSNDTVTRIRYLQILVI